VWGSSARVRARERAQLSHNTPKHNEHSRYLFSASSPSFSFHGAVVFLAQAYAPWVATVTYKMQPEVAQLFKLVLTVGGFKKKNDEKDTWIADDGEAVESVFGHETTRSGFNMLRRSCYFGARSIASHKLATPLWNPLVAPDEIIYAQAFYELDVHAYGSDNLMKPAYVLRRLIDAKLTGVLKPDWRVRSVASVDVDSPFTVAFKQVVGKVDGAACSTIVGITTSFSFNSRSRTHPGPTWPKVLFRSQRREEV
jgi:hypothetical protein